MVLHHQLLTCWCVQGRVVHKGPLVQTAAGAFVLKAVVAGERGTWVQVRWRSTSLSFDLFQRSASRRRRPSTWSCRGLWLRTSVRPSVQG